MIIDTSGHEALELYFMFGWVFASLGLLYLLQRWWTSYK